MISAELNSLIVDAIQRDGSDTDFSEQYIAKGYFSCFCSTSEATYRIIITGTRNHNAGYYASLVQEWVSSGVSTRLQWYIVKIDEACPVIIDSFEKNECQPSLYCSTN